jgi:hypothetical protein
MSKEVAELRRRHRVAVATSDHVDQGLLSDATYLLDHDAAMSLVDDVLVMVSAHDAFARSDALELLHRVETTLREVPAAVRVVEIVEAAEQRSQDQVTLPRAAVVDPLLDIRLALVG